MKKLHLEMLPKLNWIYSALYFFKKHFIIILGLGLIAALGRAVQFKAFGQIPSWLFIVSEVIVESARLMIFLYVLGLANVKNGALRIKHLFIDKDNLKQNWVVAIQTLKKQWPAILLNIIVFSAIAWTINYLIDQLVYETCLYITLKNGGILAPPSSKFALIFFFKNISVIPFTIIFNTLFLLWVTNKFRSLIADPVS